MSKHSDLYIKTLNGDDCHHLNLLNYPLMNYCYEKYKDSITNHIRANEVLREQSWVDWVWHNKKHILTPKYIYHVDFDLFVGGEYPTLLSSLISNAASKFRNIVTSIHLKLGQPEAYYFDLCRRLDKFLLNNKVFDYLNIYIDANEVELADAWLDTPVYTSYSNVFDVIRLCSCSNLIKVNVLIVKKQSPKTGRPIYENILKSRFEFGWPLNLYNKHREFRNNITLVPINGGKTVYIKNIHMNEDNVIKTIEKHWTNRTFTAIEFDSRMTMLPNASKIGDTRYRIELSPLPTLTARLSTLLPWLRNYASQ